MSKNYFVLPALSFSPERERILPATLGSPACRGKRWEQLGCAKWPGWEGRRAAGWRGCGMEGMWDGGDVGWKGCRRVKDAVGRGEVLSALWHRQWL